MLVSHLNELKALAMRVECAILRIVNNSTTITKSERAKIVGCFEGHQPFVRFSLIKKLPERDQTEIANLMDIWNDVLDMQAGQ